MQGEKEKPKLYLQQAAFLSETIHKKSTQSLVR